MNLQALQYIDINSVIAEGLSNETGGINSSLVQRIEGSGMNRYVVVEGRRYTAKDRYGNYRNGERPLYLKAQPAFANSLLSTEIRVSLPYTSNEGFHPRVVDPCVDEHTVQPLETIDIPVDTELYYHLQEPLPNNLGARLYRKGIHVVLVMDDLSRLEISDTSLIGSIHQQFEQSELKKRFQPRVIVPCFIDASLSQCADRRTHLSNGVKIDLLKLSHFCHRINIIGKSDLVLCDSSGIAVDAIRSSVPIAFIAGVPKGYEKLQDALLDFLQHKCRHRLLQEQQAALNAMLHQPDTNTYIMSNQSTLRSLIRGVTRRFTDSCTKSNHELIADTMSHLRDAVSQLRFQNQDALILHTQHTMCSTTSKSVKLKTGLESSRRKYQKFRESPARFMEDSQSSFLRYLAANK